MIKIFAAITALFLFASDAGAAELHVSTSGSDDNPGTRKLPFRTIQHAADLAQPGDVVTVHDGIYRERVNPPRGGQSDAKRIIFQAAHGEKVVITGSEVIRNWEHVTNAAWRVTIPNDFFRKFNPYADLIHGDWFYPQGRQHHTGAVYLNGDWLVEAANLKTVLNPASANSFWFGVVSNGTTTIWAQFKGVNPNEQPVEINVRQTVFYPGKPGVNYLTVRGFTLEHAATPWAPPTAEQVGIIGTHWSKGWIIENNVIRYSKCSGVALGKYGDEWDNRAESAEGYVGTLTRALTNGWNKATVGGHLVRNNEISHCEQTGVVGSLGCSFSAVTGNDIHEIYVQRLFSGAEMAGIKFHGAIDVTIGHNHIHRCGCHGIWLDWMGQGAQITGNLIHDNQQFDIFCEMQHGPMLIANNILLSRGQSLFFNSQGIAVVHNLIAGPVSSYRSDTRITPFQRAHSTELAGMHAATDGDSGDHRFYNNLIVAPCDLQVLDNSAFPCFAAGNVFAKGARPSKFDADALLLPGFEPGLELAEKPDGWYLNLATAKGWATERPRRLVTSGLLGEARVSRLPFENIDGSPLRVETDYFGKKRNKKNPIPGPFEKVGNGQQHIKVWQASPQ